MYEKMRSILTAEANGFLPSGMTAEEYCCLFGGEVGHRLHNLLYLEGGYEAALAMDVEGILRIEGAQRARRMELFGF